MLNVQLIPSPGWECHGQKPAPSVGHLEGASWGWGALPPICRRVWLASVCTIHLNKAACAHHRHGRGLVSRGSAKTIHKNSLTCKTDAWTGNATKQTPGCSVLLCEATSPDLRAHSVRRGILRVLVGHAGGWDVFMTCTELDPFTLRAATQSLMFSSHMFSGASRLSRRHR